MNELNSPQMAESTGDRMPTMNGAASGAANQAVIIPVEDETDAVIVGESSLVLLEEAEDTAVPRQNEATTTPIEPEFDAVHSLTRLLVGSALEGSAELARRLALWEEYVREDMAEAIASTMAEGGAAPGPQQADLTRHALIGLVFAGEEQARRGLSRLWGMQKRLAQTAVRTTHPITRSRLMNPVQRRLDQAAERGQAEIVRWIERGQLEEPVSRELARLAFGEVVDEFIEHLAENKEVQELVQQQSVGLATEMVGQVRERTFTADTLVERIARAITRRSPRLEPPPADLSEFEQGPTLRPESK